jgi:ankyrin repeat protein
MLASESGCLGVVQLLLERGATVDAHDSFGVTSLLAASRDGLSGVVRVLLAQGHAAPDKAQDGNTPLMVAADNGKHEVVRLLLMHDAKVNLTRPVDGFTALLFAAQWGYTEVVRCILTGKNKVNVDAASTDEGATALLFAAQRGYTEVVRLLLRHEADVNQARSDGLTPLALASENGHARVVLWLLRSAAAPPLDLASRLHDMSRQKRKTIIALYLCFHPGLAKSLFFVPGCAEARHVANKVRVRLTRERNALAARLSGAIPPEALRIFLSGFLVRTELDWVREFSTW